MAHGVSLTTPHSGDDTLRSYSMLSTAPGPLVGAGDFLRLNATSVDATATLNLNGRLLTLAGEVVPFALSMPITVAGDQTAKITSLTDGWIIGFVVYVASGTITDGEVVASVEVVQATGTGATRVMCLASGDVTNTRELGLGAFTAATAAQGVVQGSWITTNIAAPAAGESVLTGPTIGQVWELAAMTANFAASADVASRQLELSIFLDGVAEYYVVDPTAITAGVSLAAQFNIGQPVSLAITGHHIVAMNPWPLLRYPTTVELLALHMQAADEFTGCSVTYRRVIG